MIGRDTLTSRASDEWSTPAEVFNQLDQEFRFTLDPCCTASTALCETFYTKEDDGLCQNWGGAESILQPAILSNR